MSDLINRLRAVCVVGVVGEAAPRRLNARHAMTAAAPATPISPKAATLEVLTDALTRVGDAGEVAKILVNALPAEALGAIVNALGANANAAAMQPAKRARRGEPDAELAEIRRLMGTTRHENPVTHAARGRLSISSLAPVRHEHVRGVFGGAR